MKNPVIIVIIITGFYNIYYINIFIAKDKLKKFLESETMLCLK